MKSLVFALGIIAYASICFAQVTLNVTSYTQITTNASYNIVNIAENAVLELSGTAIVNIYNYTVQSDAAGKIYMGNNSTIIVHQNAELHVANSVNGLLGEIVAIATTATIRNITIENSGFVETEAIRNDNQYNVNLNNSTDGTGTAEVSIYNLRGQLVKRLVNTEQDAAMHSTVWNGKNDAGQVVASGVYFCRVKSGSTHTSHKIMLMK